VFSFSFFLCTLDIKSSILGHPLVLHILLGSIFTDRLLLGAWSFPEFFRHAPQKDKKKHIFHDIHFLPFTHWRPGKYLHNTYTIPLTTWSHISCGFYEKIDFRNERWRTTIDVMGLSHSGESNHME